MPTRRRRFPLRRILLFVGLFLLVAYVVLPPVSRTAAARRLLVRALSSWSGYQASIDDLGLGYDLSLFARRLSLAAPEREPFLTAEEVRFFPTLWRVWQGRVGEVELRAPHLYLHRMEPRAGGGRRNARPSALALLGVEVGGAYLHHEIDGNVVDVGPVDLELGSIKTGDSLELSGGTRLGQAEIHGTATLGIQTGFFVARIGSRIADLRDLARALTARELPPAVATTSGRALLTLQGELQGRIGGTFEAELHRPSFPHTVSVGGNVEAWLSPLVARTELSITLDPELPEVAIDASIGGEEPGGETWTANAKARDLPIDRLQGWLSPADLVLEGALDVDARVAGTRDQARVEGEARVRRGRLRTSVWEAAANATVPFRLEDGRMVLAEPGMRADDVHGRFADFEWKIGGVAARGSVTVLEAQPAADLQISVSDAGLHDAEFLRAAQGIAAEGTVTIGLPESGALAIEAQVASRKGELLWDRFYLNLSNRPATLRGRMRRDGTRLAFEAVEAALEGVGKLEGNARYDLASGEHALATQAAVADLGELFQVAVRDPLRQSYPALAQTTVAGRLRARLSSKGGPTARPNVEAEIKVDDARIESPDPAVEIEDVQVDIPVLLANAAAATPSRGGRIAFGGMELGGVTVAPFEIGLRVSPNRVTLAEPLHVELLGGQLALERLALAQKNGALPELNLGLSLDGLDLARLTEAMSWPPLRGTITGKIPDMRLVDRALRSDAEIRVQVFGGEVRVRNLRFDEIFSSVPAVALDAEFTDLSLGDFTKAFDVGRVSGIANGAVKDLVIVDGQPVSFEAWMETVERRGVDQRISVSAVRQLSILGGAGGDAFTQGVLSFFEDYGYAKMGFRSRLENDRFYLRGVKSEDGKEYLVVGSTLPPRVNVVSHSQVISFSEMVKRLARAFQERGEPREKGPGNGGLPNHSSVRNLQPKQGGSE